MKLRLYAYFAIGLAIFGQVAAGDYSAEDGADSVAISGELEYGDGSPVSGAEVKLVCADDPKATPANPTATPMAQAIADLNGYFSLNLQKTLCSAGFNVVAIIPVIGKLPLLTGVSLLGTALGMGTIVVPSAQPAAPAATPTATATPTLKSTMNTTVAPPVSIPVPVSRPK